MLMLSGYDGPATGAYSETMTEWGIDTLFNPGKRHMDEEKRRLQSTREEVGDASGGRRVDFDAGKVTISRPSKDQPAPEEADSGTDVDGSETAGTDSDDDGATADSDAAEHPES
jgi:hypothetical protein